MRKVLFIGVTKFDFQKFPPLHLERKYSGLSQGIKAYVLSKGQPFHKKIWNTEFYLLPPGFLGPLAFFLGFYLCLAKKIDTIVTQSPLLEGLVGTALKRLFKKELIVEIHGDWIEGPFLSKKRKFESLERKIVPILARISFKNANKIRGVANYLIEKAKKIAPNKKYFLFPTFTDIDIFLNEKETKFENFILFVGALEKVKGVEYLIEAFSKIETGFPGFKLIIVGDGSELNNLKLQIANLKLEDKVEFKGRLPLEETKNIMKNCYCLVLPSLSEGLPRVLMEAMALGKPVIGSNVGGIPDLIKDSNSPTTPPAFGWAPGKNGFLVEKGNSEDLAEKLKILLKDKNFAIEMGRRGREFVKEKFSNERYILAYIEMINS